MNDPTDTPSTTSLIDLPTTVEGAFEVYINGILQNPGTDYHIDGRTLVFPRSLQPEIKMSKRHWVLVTIGIGSYSKHDTIDVIYHHDGRNLVATGLQPRSGPERPSQTTR